MSKSTTKYSNNARTTLSANILASDTTIPVMSSIGFPSIVSTGDHFFITIDDGSNLEIVKITGVSGNNFVNCVRAQEGTTARDFNSTTTVENRLTAGSITQFARLQDRLHTVASLDDVTSPATTDGNSVLCATTDAIGTPVVLVANGTTWRLLNYPDRVRSGLIGATSTSTSLSSTGIGNNLKESVPNTYVIQITSGDNIGICRFINTISTDSISWVTPIPFPVGLLATDTYEIFRCVGSWKAPFGTNSDRMFFENDNIVYFDYTIPVGRNASSAGPVTINSGATVTVSAGSSWSIV